MLRQTMKLALAIALTTTSITPVSAGYLGVEVAKGSRGGVRIVKVLPGSPAKELGLQEGSEILAVNDNRSSSPDAFVAQVKQLTPGTWATLAVAVGDTVVTGFATTQDPKSAQQGQPFALNGRGLLDIQTEDATGNVRGARIVGLRPEGAGSKAGLMTGDLVIEIAGNRIGSASDLIAEISARAGIRTDVTVLRRGRVQSVYVVPDVADEKGTFASASVPQTKESSNEDLHWCKQSDWQFAVCVAGGIIAVAILSSGGSSSESRSETDSAAQRKQREREAQQSFERAMDEQARAEGRRPN